MNRSTKFITATILAIVGIAGWITLVRGNETISFGWKQVEGEQTNGLQNILRISYGYIVTLIGVILGAFYRKMQDMKKAGENSITNTSVFFKTIFRDINLWMALCASPIIYALVVKAADGLSWPSFTFIGLENGFFCLSIISAIAGEKEKTVAASATDGT